VAVIHDIQSLRNHAATLFAECPEILAEEFLSGEEITIAIMPPGEFDVSLHGQDLILDEVADVCQSNRHQLASSQLIGHCQ
jgi:hypothetical protein